MMHMGKRHPSNRVVVSKEDPAAASTAFTVLTMLACFIAGIVITIPSVTVTVPGGICVSYTLFAIAGMVFLAVKVAPVAMMAIWRSITSLARRSRARNRGKKPQRRHVKLDHELLHDHVLRHFFECRGTWRFSRLAAELAIDPRDEEQLGDMLWELHHSGAAAINNCFVTFKCRNYNIPEGSPYRSTPPPLVRSPSVAVDRKACTDQNQPAAPKIGGVPGKKHRHAGNGKKKSTGEKHEAARKGRGPPRRAKPQKEKTRAEAEKFSARVARYIDERAGKGDTRLAFEQVQRGLGVADGKVNRLRAELDKLVSRGFIVHDGAWYLLGGIGKARAWTGCAGPRQASMTS